MSVLRVRARMVTGYLKVMFSAGGPPRRAGLRPRDCFFLVSRLTHFGGTSFSNFSKSPWFTFNNRRGDRGRRRLKFR